MSRVSYQVAVDPPGATSAFRTLDRNAIGTRRRDAKITFTAKISKRQSRWLRQVARPGGPDADAVVRAVIDLAMELAIDWSAVTSAADLRAAVRESVLIRRP